MMQRDGKRILGSDTTLYTDKPLDTALRYRAGGVDRSSPVASLGLSAIDSRFD